MWTKRYQSGFSMCSSAGIPQRALKALENLSRMSKCLAMDTLLGMGVWGAVGMLAMQLSVQKFYTWCMPQPFCPSFGQLQLHKTGSWPSWQAKKLFPLNQASVWPEFKCPKNHLSCILLLRTSPESYFFSDLDTILSQQGLRSFTIFLK